MGCLCEKIKEEEKIKIDKSDMCMRCNINDSKYIREFNYKKLPHEYFYKPHEFIIAILKIQNINPYPDYWIQLPPELKLTRYKYKVCSNCFIRSILNENIYQWNEWKEL